MCYSMYVRVDKGRHAHELASRVGRPAGRYACVCVCMYVHHGQKNRHGERGRTGRVVGMGG